MDGDLRSDGLRRRFGLGRIAGGLAIAAVLAVALVVAAGALALVSERHRAVSPTHAISGRQGLLDVIRALRRSQTPADLHSPAIAQLLSTYHDRRLVPGWGAPDRPLIRRAIVSPWGQGVFLIPVKPGGRHGQEGLAWATGGFIDCCTTAAETKTFGEVNNAGQVNDRTGGRREPIDRFVAVVPDGVAKIQLGHLVMTVRNNVAAAQANGKRVGATPVILWFGPGGNLIRRIGFVGGSYRSVAVK